MNKRVLMWANAGAFTSAAASLALIPPLWWFSYFWLDDFGFLYWVRRESFATMLIYVIDPGATVFRPVGLFFYWVCFHLFGLDALPYHALAWGLHALNAFLLFLLLRRLLHSPFAAVFGVIPFTFRWSFAEIYWSFGTIFELLACCLMLAGFHLYMRVRQSLAWILPATFVYILAIKSKEMAITLVALWFLFEAFVTGNVMQRRTQIAVRLTLPFIVALWFTYVKVRAMRNPDPTEPYFMDFNLRTLLVNYGQYLKWLGGKDLPIVVFWIAVACVFSTLVIRREKVGLFFAFFVPVAFLPVIFLPNHRAPFFWYIPFIGMSGLVAVAAKHWLTWLRSKMMLRRVVALNVTLLVCVTCLNSIIEYRRTGLTRLTEAQFASSFREFVVGLQNLEVPPENATLYFIEAPPGFNQQTLDRAVQVILNRDDIHARLVSFVPPDAGWGLRFSGGKVERVGAP